MRSILNNISEQVTDADIRNLEGKLLTLIETVGLPEKQENALKSNVKNILWDKWAEVIDREVLYYNGTIYKITENGTLEVTGGYTVSDN